MPKIGFQVNSIRHKAFKDFERGRHPSELVRRYGCSFDLLNHYYHEWKICRRRRAEFLPQCKAIRDKLAVERPELRRHYGAVHQRLKAKPLEWWWRKETPEAAIRGVLF